jgi:hypothetical protein
MGEYEYPALKSYSLFHIYIYVCVGGVVGGWWWILLSQIRAHMSFASPEPDTEEWSEAERWSRGSSIWSLCVSVCCCAFIWHHRKQSFIAIRKPYTTIGNLLGIPLIDIFGNYSVLCEESNHRIIMSSILLLCLLLTSVDFLVTYTQLSMKQYWSDRRQENSISLLHRVNISMPEGGRRRSGEGGGEGGGGGRGSIGESHSARDSIVLETTNTKGEVKASTTNNIEESHHVDDDMKPRFEGNDDTDDNYKVSSSSSYPERIVQWTLSKKRTLMSINIGILIFYIVVRLIQPLSSCSDTDLLLSLIFLMLIIIAIILLYWVTKYGSRDTIGLRNSMLATNSIAFIALMVGSIFTYIFHLPSISKLKSITNALLIHSIMIANLYYPIRLLYERKLCFNHSRKSSRSTSIVNVRPLSASFLEPYHNNNNNNNSIINNSHSAVNADNNDPDEKQKIDDHNEKVPESVLSTGSIRVSTSSHDEKTSSRPSTNTRDQKVNNHAAHTLSPPISSSSSSSSSSVAATPPTNRTSTSNHGQQQQQQQQKTNVAPSFDISRYESVFHDQALQKEFHTFLKGEFSCENLLFEKAVRKHKKRKDINVESLKVYSRDIYNLYVSLDSNLQVNLSGQVAAPIHDIFKSSSSSSASNINSTAQNKEGTQNGNVEVEFWKNVFNAAVNEVHQMVQKDSWPRFLAKRKKG